MVDASTIIYGAIEGIVFLGGLLGLNKAGLLQWIKKEEPVIKEFASEILHLPVAKVVEEKLHIELDSITKKFQASEIGRLAAVALNYTAKDLSQLSDDQKRALTLHVSTLLPAEWNVSKTDIENALETAQRASDAIANSSLIQAADKFTLEQNQASGTVQGNVTVDSEK